MPLFRRIASQDKGSWILGSAIVVIPVLWRSIGVLIFGSVATGLLFLSLAGYSRIEIELVDGASHRYAEAFLVGAAAGAFIGGFGGPEGAAAGALIGGLIGVGIIAIP